MMHESYLTVFIFAYQILVSMCLYAQALSFFYVESSDQFFCKGPKITEC